MNWWIKMKVWVNCVLRIFIGMALFCKYLYENAIENMLKNYITNKEIGTLTERVFVDYVS